MLSDLTTPHFSTSLPNPPLDVIHSDVLVVVSSLWVLDRVCSGSVKRLHS